MYRRLSLIWLHPLLFKPQIVLSNGHFFSAAVCVKYVSLRQPEQIGVGRQPNVSISSPCHLYRNLCSGLSKLFNIHDGIKHNIQGKITYYKKNYSAVYMSKPTVLCKSNTCFWQIVPGSRALEYTLRPWILELVPAPHSAFYVCREELQGISPQTSPYLYKTDNKSLHQPAEIKTENLGLISPCKNDYVWWMAVKDPSSLHD